MISRIFTGFALGVAAVIPMTTVHFLLRTAGLFPASKPVFLAVAGEIFGSGLPPSGLMVLGLACHFAYGGFWGAVLLAAARRVTVWKGIGLGLFLWLAMQLLVLPFVGYGAFASHVTWKLAPASVVTHLVYGAALGALGARATRPAPATQAATARA